MLLKEIILVGSIGAESLMLLDTRLLKKEAITMCSPLCLEALYGPASRRGFIQKSILAAAAVACGARAASGAADGSKWFTMENVFTFGKDKLNIHRWTVVEHTGTHASQGRHSRARRPESPRWNWGSKQGDSTRLVLPVLPVTS